MRGCGVVHAPWPLPLMRAAAPVETPAASCFQRTARLCVCVWVPATSVVGLCRFFFSRGLRAAEVTKARESEPRKGHTHECCQGLDRGRRRAPRHARWLSGSTVRVGEVAEHSCDHLFFFLFHVRLLPGVMGLRPRVPPAGVLPPAGPTRSPRSCLLRHCATCLLVHCVVFFTPWPSHHPSLAATHTHTHTRVLSVLLFSRHCVCCVRTTAHLLHPLSSFAAFSFPASKAVSSSLAHPPTYSPPPPSASPTRVVLHYYPTPSHPA